MREKVERRHLWEMMYRVAERRLEEAFMENKIHDGVSKFSGHL